jgi:colanic acid/amylovoran biosynthesis glycosyltransferase
MLEGKPVVAHFLEGYLDLSATFIYQYLKNLRAFQLIVIADSTRNLDLFPLDHKIYCLSGIWKRWTWRWVEGRLNERILRRSPYGTVLKRICGKEKPELLHAHFGIKGVELLPVKRKCGLPLITTFYGVDMSKLPRERKWREVYKKLFAEGDLFLVEGGHMRRKVIELGCPSEKVKVQHIAIDLEQYEFTSRTFPKNGTIKILMCARFKEKKGIEYAIRAMDLVRAECKNIELRIIGDGELKPQIEQLIGELDLDEYITLLGYQPHFRFIEELNSAHIFLAPSVTAADGDSEGGAPTVLLEAQASGLPVVSTYHADIPEVVLDGKSGYLVPERDAQAIAEKLSYLIKNPETWSKMKKGGREHIAQDYNIHFEVRKLESLYRSLIEQRYKVE